MEIVLKNSPKKVEVDDDIGPWLGHYTWALNKNGYVYRWAGKTVLMHRQIMGEELSRRGASYIVDHIDGNTLNNRRKNLRVVKQGKNILNNFNPRKDNKSGVVGVSWFAKARKWKVYLGHEYLGSYDSLEEASEIRRVAVEQAGGRHSVRKKTVDLYNLI